MFMNHLYEELLDAAQYIKKEISIVPQMQELLKKYPNDAEFGRLIRNMFSK